MVDHQVPPTAIACTLAGDGYTDRMAWIAALHERALLGAKREGHTLILTYRREAAADVRELARREKECCAFLAFDVAERAGEIVLTISAPAEAEAMLDEVFAPFEQGTACGCATSGNGACMPPSKPRTRLALAAAGLSTLALACGVCCVVPFLAPAAAAGAVGAVLTFTAGFHGIATVFAAVAVVGTWAAILLRRGSSASLGELAVTMGATIILIAALSWAQIEEWITG